MTGVPGAGFRVAPTRAGGSQFGADRADRRVSGFR
ncbi:hypothetical protein FHS01_004449 [Longimicrobium terrae]|uniref:Uncharacterized protein n=1 Tax=Longimicrobium terrae TaxID=1639882 RepID=A0A841H3L3_9BACT|nr:hypothetical protein [Longimicrobium terrae]MBB6072542.1 hypothetical protein [Longimicrobium terrae]